MVFAAYRIKNKANPKNIYFKIIHEFEKLLYVAEMDERNEGGLGKWRKVTLRSLRRFVKMVISDQLGRDYSKWFLGHAKSPYCTKKEIDRRKIYATECMKYLTFLGYTILEARGKGNVL